MTIAGVVPCVLQWNETSSAYTAFPLVAMVYYSQWKPPVFFFINHYKYKPHDHVPTFSVTIC